MIASATERVPVLLSARVKARLLSETGLPLTLLKRGHVRAWLVPVDDAFELHIKVT